MAGSGRQEPRQHVDTGVPRRPSAPAVAFGVMSPRWRAWALLKRNRSAPHVDTESETPLSYKTVHHRLIGPFTTCSARFTQTGPRVGYSSRYQS